MKKVFAPLFLLVSCLGLTSPAHALVPPVIVPQVAGTDAAVFWAPVPGAEGYTLYYAPMPFAGVETIGTIELGSATSYAQELPVGSAFLVAVKAYAGADRSDYSNIVTIQIEAAGAGPVPLQAVPSPTALQEYLKRGLARQTSPGGPYRGFFPEFAALDDMPPPAAGDAGSPGFSTTNLQVVGVDEADRLKSDGRVLYLAEQAENYAMAERAVRGVRILSLDSDRAVASELSRLEIPAALPLEGLYLVPDLSVVQADLLVSLGTSPDLFYALDWFAPWPWQQRQTEVHLIDVADPRTPVIQQVYQFDGQLVASRRIGSMLYLVLRDNPTLDTLLAYPQTPAETTRNEQLIWSATLDDLLPRYRIDGTDQGPVTPVAHCYLPPVPPEVQTADLMTVIGLDLDTPGAPPAAVSLAGPTEAVYVSTENLYVATTRTSYPAVPWGAELLTYETTMTTDLHKFALTADGPVYRGSGAVEGHLGWEQDKKSFRLGEVDDRLGVVTSTGTAWSGTETTRLTFLAESPSVAGALMPIARLPNDTRPEAIGKPGERLYAARFMNDRLYLVTFRVTDPLYVVNIADPQDPFIEGSLEIDGYSDYLHPVGQDYLLGIGKDAVPDMDAPADERGAWYQGLKIALFDVSDAAHPEEVDSLVLGRRGTHSELLVDHHALAYLQSDSGQARFALPVALHTRLESGADPAAPWTYYGWTQTGLSLFTLTGLDGPGATLAAAGSLVVARSNDHDEQQGTEGDRGMIIGDSVFYLHGNGVWAAPWTAPSELDGPQ